MREKKLWTRNCLKFNSKNIFLIFLLILSSNIQLTNAQFGEIASVITVK